jgi:hypothetical protein
MTNDRGKAINGVPKAQKTPGFAGNSWHNGGYGEKEPKRVTHNSYI